VIAECGLEMSVSPTAGHFASRAGACPGHHQSARRRDEVRYRDLGPDWQRKRHSVEHRARRLQGQLEALGCAGTLDKIAIGGLMR
jgi:hypothetical protein